MSRVLTMLPPVVPACHQLKEQTRVTRITSNVRDILSIDAWSFQWSFSDVNWFVGLGSEQSRLDDNQSFLFTIWMSSNSLLSWSYVCVGTCAKYWLVHAATRLNQRYQPRNGAHEIYYYFPIEKCTRMMVRPCMQQLCRYDVQANTATDSPHTARRRFFGAPVLVFQQDHFPPRRA
jgi:hypothetical protein